jgi:hypothetical protein
VKGAFFLLVLCLLLVRCSSRTLVGNYRHKSGWEYWTGLQVFPDSTYHFEYRVGNVWIVSEGKWSRNNNTLSLQDTLSNSIEELKVMLFSIKNRSLVGPINKGDSMILRRY